MHMIAVYLMQMRTTLDLPEALIAEAMSLTHRKTKTDVIKYSLETLIQRERTKEIKRYRGKVRLDIDLNASRRR